MIIEHNEMRGLTENETWERIDKAKEENKQMLALQIDRGMKQKGELTLTQNKYKEKKMEQEASLDEIKRNDNLLNEKFMQAKQLNRQILSYNEELKERNNTIEDKDKRINELKKKT